MKIELNIDMIGETLAHQWGVAIAKDTREGWNFMLHMVFTMRELVAASRDISWADYADLQDYLTMLSGVCFYHGSKYL